MNPMSPKDAFHQTVHAADGGCSALAVRLGMSAQVLRNKANPNNAANVVTIDDIDRVMSLTGDYAVLHALAANHGFVCVQVEEGAASDMGVLELMTKYWSANGEVGTEIMKALEDGRVTRDELVRVQAAIKRTERDLEQVFARLQGMAEV